MFAATQNWSNHESKKRSRDPSLASDGSNKRSKKEAGDSKMVVIPGSKKESKKESEKEIGSSLVLEVAENSGSSKERPKSCSSENVGEASTP